MSDELTISEAVQRYEVSRKTVRRRLAEGAIEGARQRPGDHGPEWVFPAASLEALGYGSRAPGAPGSLDAVADAGFEADEGEIERQFEDGPDQAAAGQPPARRMAGVWVLLALIFGPLIGFLFANLVQSDDISRPPLTAVLAELTEPGDEIGVVAPLEADLPTDRVAVPIEDLDLAGAGSPTRYVVIGEDGPAETLAALKESAQAVLALDQAADPVWIFDTEADPVLVSATTAVTTTSEVPDTGVGPKTTDASPTTVSPTTVSPATTTPSTTAPPTTAPSTTAPAADPAPSVDGEGAPDVDSDGNTGEGTTVRGTVTVQAGDHFWSIAEDVVTQALGSTPTDAQITSYWAQLIDANADQLAEPGNPDLLLPGQVLQLPPL